MASQMWAAQLAVTGGHHHGLRLILLILILIIVVAGVVLLVRRAKRPRHVADDWKPPTVPRDGPSGETK
jgi:uncharacterized membrane protein